MQRFQSAEFFDPARTHPQACDAGIRVTTLDLTPAMSVSLLESAGAQQFLAVGEEADCARVHFSCQLGGTTRVSHPRHTFALDAHKVLVSRAPDTAFALDCSAGWRTLELRMDAHALHTLAGDEDGLKALEPENRERLLLNPNNARIHTAATRLAQAMTAANPSSLLIHSAALEFVAWQLKNLHAQRADDTLPARECRLLWQARERLLSDLSCPPTIEQLARETGLNALKIKRGFKILFGMGAYALFQRTRMEHALVLLHKHSVTETAITLGYSNVSHFSAAFRKQFGVLPRAARRGEVG